MNVSFLLFSHLKVNTMSLWDMPPVFFLNILLGLADTAFAEQTAGLYPSWSFLSKCFWESEGKINGLFLILLYVSQKNEQSKQKVLLCLSILFWKCKACLPFHQGPPFCTSFTFIVEGFLYEFGTSGIKWGKPLKMATPSLNISFNLKHINV